MRSEEFMNKNKKREPTSFFGDFSVSLSLEYLKDNPINP